MVTLFYVLCGFAIVHFAYERIVLPSIRLHYRNELFKVRDDVRHEIIFLGGDDKTMRVIHDGLNNIINRLHLLTVYNKVLAKKHYASDVDIKKKIDRFARDVDSSENEVMRRAIKDSSIIMDKVLFFNNFFLFLYMLPVALIVVAIGALVNKAKDFLGYVKAVYADNVFEEGVMLLDDARLKKLVS